jgi:hypothetical protein
MNWIPISEQPMPDDEVLVTYRWWQHGLPFIGVAEYWRLYKIKDVEIIAWMPGKSMKTLQEEYATSEFAALVRHCQDRDWSATFVAAIEKEKVLLIAEPHKASGL